MSAYPQSLQRLIRELSKLPSIGEKTATRLAYHLVQKDRALSTTLAESMLHAVQHITLCSECFFITDKEVCALCSNSSREQTVLCVVEKPMDLIAIERVGEFRGMYHVLHGLWSPLKGLGPESMKLQELLGRIERGVIKEVILATSSTVEGDATSLYIGKLIKERGIKVSRLAQGMPKGGELEYADEVTLSRAFAGRNAIE